MDDHKGWIFMKEKNILLEGKDLVKVYGTTIKTEVLHSLNFKIYQQELTAIIGQSGSGKSTVLNIIGALDKPTGGDIIFQDKAFGKLKEKELARFRNENLGFIFQFHHLLPEFTAIENVLMPTWIMAGRATKRRMDKAKELLELVGLKDRMFNKSTALSGGQQQRVAIARALINEPAILLGDEPTGNLDTDTSEQVFDLFKTINKELGTTLIIVTHDADIAAKSDRVIELKDGYISRDYRNDVQSEQPNIYRMMEVV